MVQGNNDLHKLFIETMGKSIIVIEDIDCSLDLTGDRSSRAATTTGRSLRTAAAARSARGRAR
jgi:chaperone BCS1